MSGRYCVQWRDMSHESLPAFRTWRTEFKSHDLKRAVETATLVAAFMMRKSETYMVRLWDSEAKREVLSSLEIINGVKRHARKV